jgi:putative cardiolipin synthase
MNLDQRSLHLNTEIGLVFETPDLAAQGASQLLAAVSGKSYHLVLVPEASGKSARKVEWIEQDEGREVRYDTEPQAGVWRRLGVWFMSWLPIESQL